MPKIICLLIKEKIMRPSKLLLSIMFIFSMLVSYAAAQIISERKYDPNKTVLHALESAIQAKHGNNYDISFHIMDSLIANSFPDEITDPYGTLKGCILFSAWHTWQSEDSVITGMYKNGEIIWDDYPGTKAGFASELLTTKDINNDGEVDILAPELDHERFTRESSIYYLWILSWNGTRGRIINDIDPVTHQSTLVSTDDMYDLVDFNRDGILEIRGWINRWREDFPNLNPPTLPSITYSRNGIKYGYFPSTYQITDKDFYPANLMNVSIHCTVSKSGNLYTYNYSCSNQSMSEQSVENVYIGGLEDTSSDFAPSGWQASSSSYVGGRFFYSKSFDIRGTISPGGNLGGFRTVSFVPPAVVKYYVQGFRDHGQMATDAEYRNDILTNSVTGCTIGTRDTTIAVGTLQWLDTLTSYTTQSRSLGWIKDQATADKYTGYFSSAKTSLQQNNIGATRSTLQQVLQDVNTDSTNSLTSEAYALIRYNTEYLLAQLPVPLSGFIVKLISSTGTRLTSGSLQYYEGNWKDATNNNDGTFTINTTAKTLSLRMTYEYGTQTKSNVTVGTDTAIFQTVNAQIKLQDTKGNLIDTGTVQYYAGAWRTLGTTVNGMAAKELLANSYSFRMTYAGGSNDKAQDIGVNPTVVFQTVNAAVQLQDSHGSLIDQGTVQYYAGAWRDFGMTSGGVTTKELLPNTYSFRMTYAYGSNDKQQNISTNPSVVFQTVNATVQLKNSQGNLIDTGTVQYYAGTWRNFGTTAGGVAAKELLPNNYTFRMTYGYVSNDKAQDISTNSTLAFSTVLCTINVTNSQSQPVNNVQASYYSGAWWQIGPTVNGQVTKELLPANLTFRITYGTSHQDKTQNLATNNVVGFNIP